MQINERNRKIVLLAVWAVLIALDAAGLIWCIVRLNTGTLSQDNFSYSLLHFFVSFASISGILLAEWVLRFRAGMPLVICCMLFGFFGNTVSNVWRMYDFFPAWDMVLHSLSGVLFAAVGLGLGSLVTYNQPEGKLKIVAIVAFAFFFSLSVGFIWEVFEFTVDTINPASSTQGWADGMIQMGSDGVYDIPDGTYLVDSRRGTAILDTMEDMILHLAGSLVLLIPLAVAFFRRPARMQTFAFTPARRRQKGGDERADGKSDGMAEEQPAGQETPQHDQDAQ